MDSLFLDIGNELDEYNLQCLKFLCTEYTSASNLEKITESYKLFQALYENGMLKKDDCWLLKELLFRIKRMDLLKNHMGTNHEEIKKELQDRAQISPYRWFLLDLAEQLSTGQVERVKFLLQGKISRNKLQQSTILEVLLEMERSGLLAEGNFKELKYQMQSLRRNDLVKEITSFEEAMSKGAPQQESHTDAKMLAKPELQPRKEQQQRPTSRLWETYPMGDGPLGYCLIINNYDFSASQTKKFKPRQGTGADAEALRKIFQRLRFRVEERPDLTAQEIRQAMEEYRTKDHKEMYCFVCCVLSHGNRGIVYGTDGQQVPLMELIDCVSGLRCSSLADKPKVFFIQACQGNWSQPGIHIQKDSDQNFESDAAPMSSLPIMADFLVGMATVEDYESYRHTLDGSIYMQCLCKHLENLCPREEDLLTILTEVNKEVATKVLKGCKQMPEFRITLRKKLIFPAPLPEPDGLREAEDMDTCD